MKLIVTDNGKFIPDLEYAVMPVAEFNRISNHPFIASSNFECIILDLNSQLEIKYIQAVVANNIVIPLLGDTIDSRVIGMLSEIYKDRAAELRYTFIRDRANINNFINEMRKQYRWDDFYIKEKYE